MNDFQCLYRNLAVIAAPGANTNMLATSVVPAHVGKMRVTIRLATASVLNVIIVLSDTTSVTCGLNGSAALAAGDLYSFEFGCHGGNSYNFQVETDGVISVLQVDFFKGQ